MSDSRKDRRDLWDSKKNNRFDKANTNGKVWKKGHHTRFSEHEGIDEFDDEKFDWRKWTERSMNNYIISEII